MTVACRFISAGQLLFLDGVQEQADEPSQRQNISRDLLSQLDQKVIEIMHMFTNSQALQSTCFDILQTIMRLSKRAYGQAVFEGESREVTFLSNVQKAMEQNRSNAVVLSKGIEVTLPFFDPVIKKAEIFLDMAQALVDAQAGRGEISVSLLWNNKAGSRAQPDATKNKNSLRLSVLCAKRQPLAPDKPEVRGRISAGTKQVGGGHLDVDATGIGDGDYALQNVFWKVAESGVYNVSVATSEDGPQCECWIQLCSTVPITIRDADTDEVLQRGWTGTECVKRTFARGGDKAGCFKFEVEEETAFETAESSCLEQLRPNLNSEARELAVVRSGISLVMTALSASALMHNTRLHKAGCSFLTKIAGSMHFREMMDGGIIAPPAGRKCAIDVVFTTWQKASACAA